MIQTEGLPTKCLACTLWNKVMSWKTKCCIGLSRLTVSNVLGQECKRHSHRLAFTCSKTHGHPPDPYLPHQGQCYGWTGPCGSLYDHRMYLSKTIREDLKNKIHSEVTGIAEGWKPGPRPLPLFGSKCGVLRVLHFYSLLVNLKYKSRN